MAGRLHGKVMLITGAGSGLGREVALLTDPAAAVMPLRLGRPPTLRDNAWPIIFLASDESAYMSGVCFPTVDGGQHARTSIPFPDSWVLSARARGR